MHLKEVESIPVISFKKIILESLSGSQIERKLQEMPQVSSVSGDDGGKCLQAHLFTVDLNVSETQFASSINQDEEFKQYAVFDDNGKCLILNVVEDLYWSFLDDGYWGEIGSAFKPEIVLQKMVNDVFKKQGLVTNYQKYLNTDYSEIMNHYINNNNE